MSQPYDPGSPAPQEGSGQPSSGDPSAPPPEGAPPSYPPPSAPPQGGYPPPGQGYPPPSAPPQGGYPPPGQGYPQQYPPQSPPGQGYPPPPSYPPQAGPPSAYGQPAPYGQPPAYGQPGGYAAAPPPTGEYGVPGLPPLPPGTELATAGRRIGTYLLELVLVVVTLGIGYLIWTLIVWANGQTPGKQVMGLRIYHLQNQRAASWGQMFLRQFVGGIVNGILYIGFIVSVVFLFTDPLRRTVPDRIAGTIELSDPNKVLAPHK